MTNHEPRFEQLINGLAHELFFPEDLHRANGYLPAPRNLKSLKLIEVCKRGVARTE